VLRRIEFSAFVLNRPGRKQVGPDLPVRSTYRRGWVHWSTISSPSEAKWSTRRLATFTSDRRALLKDAPTARLGVHS
jgi:hypothetical protein